MMMGFRIVTVSALLLLAGSAVTHGAARLTPLVVDGERFFTLEWHAADVKGRPQVYGTIRNEFGFGARKVRLLVDSLDAGGAVTGQTLVYVPGELLPGSRYYFETPVPAPAAGYRVLVFQYEWIQAGGGDAVR
jgi:hypothetical protein